MTTRTGGLRRLRRTATLGPGAGISTLGGATSFYAPLTTSLSAWGLGSTTPTYSRATAAYVQDHEGVQRQVLANEARFWGARRVANLYAHSQDVTNAAWINVAMTVTAGDVDPFGKTNAQRLTGNGVLTSHQITQFAGGTAVGNTFTMSRWLKTFDGTDAYMFLLDGSSVQGVHARVNLNTGVFVTGPSAAGAATNINGGIIPVGNGWYRVWLSCTFSAGATTNPNAGVALQDGGSVNLSTAQGIICYGNQLENVTGQSVVTPSEYVSTNVLSSPWFGANVDGVQYFNTTLSGAPIPATTLLGYLSEAAGTQLVTPNAAIRNMTDASWTLGATMARAFTSTGVDGVANSATRLTGGAVAATNTITQTLVAAASSRTYSCYIRRVTGTGPVQLTQDNFATSTNISGQLIAGKWVRVSLNASQLNAQYGIKIDTNLDAIDVDFNQFEASAGGASSVMATTGASRNSDYLSYNSSGNISNLLGTAYAEFSFPLAVPQANSSLLVVNGGAIGWLMYTGAAYALVATEFTNFATPPGSMSATAVNRTATGWQANTGAPNGLTQVRNGTTLSGTACIAAGMGSALTNISVISGGNHYCTRNVRIYSQKFTDAQLTAMVA